MSDEEKNTPVPEESPGPVRWEGPGSRKWPQALGSRAPSAPQEEVPLEVQELTEEEFLSIAGEKALDLHETPPEGQPDGETVAMPPVKAESAPEKPARKTASTKKKPKEKKEKRRRKPREPEPDPWEEEREYRPIRTRRDSRIGCLGGLMYATFIICLSIVLAAFMWMAASDVLALNKTTGSVEVTLPSEAFYQKDVDVKDEDGNVTGSKTVRAADIKTVSAILKDAGLINYKWLFQLYSNFSHAELKLDPGTYSLSTNLDYRALVTKMQIGADSQLQTLVMFPEGFNMDQTFAKLEEAGVCTAESLYEAAATTEFSYAFLEGVEPGDPYRLEGFLFPDTYYFYQGMQASSAINKFLSNLHYRVTEEMWQQTNALNLTFRQVMTVASLIEKEAANDDERPLIASVIYNRLAAGMPLQFDSTIVYARRDTGDTTVTPEIIQETDSPYNTYLNNGLPPGPICNPGMKSIKAALEPAETRYLYFALDVENELIRFFVNFNEFEAFVATQDYSGQG